MKLILRNEHEITSTTRLFSYPYSAVYKQLHSQLCNCLYTFNTNKNPRPDAKLILYAFLTSLILMLCSSTIAANELGRNLGIELELAYAHKLEQEGQLEFAKNKLEYLFKVDPEHLDIRLSYGRLLIKMGHIDNALSLLIPLTTLSTKDWRPWFWAGTAQLINKDLENAGLFLDEALAREGEQVAIWVQRAIVEQEKNNPQAAIYMLQVADNLQPGNPDVVLNFAYASESVGDIRKSVIAYKQFLKISTAEKKYGRLRSLVLVRLSQLKVNNKVLKKIDGSF